KSGPSCSVSCSKCSAWIRCRDALRSRRKSQGGSNTLIIESKRLFSKSAWALRHGQFLRAQRLSETAAGHSISLRTFTACARREASISEPRHLVCLAWLRLSGAGYTRVRRAAQCSAPAGHSRSGGRFRPTASGLLDEVTG